jgi:hypothetical protein
MKSFFLTDNFGTYTAESSNQDYTTVATAVLSNVKPISKETVNFKEVTRQVIAYLEGGYYSPKTSNVRDPRYYTSGETLFGIDRKNGGAELTTTPTALKFWKAIDDTQNQSGKWPYLYIPPDPLQSQLVDYVAVMMEERFNRMFNANFKNANVKSIVKSDGRLLFNFIYASWNGDGWFQKFATSIESAYNKGTKDPEDLVRLAVSLRTGDKNSLIKQGGYKIKGLFKLR